MKKFKIGVEERDCNAHWFIEVIACTPEEAKAVARVMLTGDQIIFEVTET